MIKFYLQQETRREKVKEAKSREQRLKMKSLRNFENECPIGNIKNDEKNLKYFNNHDEILIHCEEDYENAIKAELIKEQKQETIVNNKCIINRETN